jgi:hypothetical protein
MLREAKVCYGSHKKTPRIYCGCQWLRVQYSYNLTKEVKMSERMKGYTGNVLDGKKLAKIANDIYRAQYSNDFSECTVDNLLLIELEEKNVFGDPKYAVLCSEGVGWEQDTYGCLEIPTNIGQMGLWNGRVFISVDTVKSCQTIFKEDVSDYIRVFGSRLDSNCSLWQSKMSVAPATILG